jgi:hypothetical protein
MRILYLLLLLLLIGHTAARAQLLPPVQRQDSLVQTPINTDTAAAIHRFYVAKRHARTRVMLVTGGLFVAYVALGNIFGRENYGSYGGDEIRIFNATALAIPVFSGELLFYGMYSRRHERISTEDFKAHQLRSRLREQLKPKYFQPAPLRDKRSEKVYWR